MEKITDKEKQLILDLLEHSYHVHPLILNSKMQGMALAQRAELEYFLDLFSFETAKLFDWLNHLDERTLYFFYERFELNFCLLKFPYEKEYLFIGPYLTKEIPESFIQKLLSSQSQIRSTFIHLKTFYQQLPIIDDKSITAFMNQIAKFCYGDSHAYQVKRVNKYLITETQKQVSQIVESQRFNPDAIKLIEERYQIENRLLKAVIAGNKREAIACLGSFEWRMENAYEDNLEERRNRLVIFNTLLRKGIEASQVRPFYIDQLSRTIAKKIANVSSFIEADNLHIDVLRAYCDLVKQYSFPSYSPLIREAINLITIYTNKKFELSELAAELNINSSYLSQLFKRETGETITAYTTKLKIQIAKKKLSESNYLIQEVAASIGMYDVNYFSKLFKKHVGLTPRDYRKKYQSF